jgi:hypothetical protein
MYSELFSVHGWIVVVRFVLWRFNVHYLISSLYFIDNHICSEVWKYFLHKFWISCERIHPLSNILTNIVKWWNVSLLLRLLYVFLAVQIRSNHNIHVPFNLLSVYQHSYFPCTIQAWNSLDLTNRNLPTFSSFKLKLQQIFYTKRRNPQYYSKGDGFLSVLHSRMRKKCSAPNNNKSIFTGIPIKFNLFISNNIIIRDKVNLLQCNT